jgi:chromosome segregation protein
VPDPQPDVIGQLDVIQKQTLELKAKLKDYGMVNLLAIEEYEKEKERLDFMENQMQDLISAKEDLLSTITEINNQARELFFETFEKVKANFKIILAEVFDGGEADLLLEEGVDPLEAQIEIMAQPRGKKLITLSQLSGGEKALVAISLLFSVYLVKPSPFCILDEVDAPLDDSNVGRYIKLLRKFAGQTQFIIITHNKLSMEAADSLYGITMATPGESEIVSVKFNQILSAN